MATPTTNLNLLKPSTGEFYNVQLTDDNLDKIDAAASLISSIKSTLTGTTWDCTGSGFTKIAIGKDGIVTATVALIAKTAVPLNANNGAYTLVGIVVPPGFRPKWPTSPSLIGAVSGAGQGAVVEASIGGDGSVQLRSGSSSAYTTVVNSTLFFNASWEWDGNS